MVQRFLLQRINDAVFRQPAQVMENIARVTTHVVGRLRDQGINDTHRRTLTLVPTTSAGACYVDEQGAYRRMYPFIENTRVYEAVETPQQAEQAGRAFGTFQSLLADLPPPRLHETIPDFHNTPLRLAAFEQTVRADRCGRAATVPAEIDAAFARRNLAPALLDRHHAGGIPERIVHNDAKITNILFDAAGVEALCVTDLDTVMPGLALYDFGDMLRSMISLGTEDDQDLSRIGVQMPLFEGLARGYLAAGGSFLRPAERDALVTAGLVITYEQGLRFLTDYLDGDCYYRTSRPGHNLDRCRTQFKLLESMERHAAQMRAFVARAGAQSTSDR